MTLPFCVLHPGRLTAGSPTNHQFGKENDLNQTSIFGHVPAVNLQGCNWHMLEGAGNEVNV